MGAFEVGDPVLLGDADLSGRVDFADIPAFIDVLLSGVFLDEADVDRSGVVDFADIPAFINALLSDGSSAVTSQSVVLAPLVSSVSSLVSYSEPRFEPVSVARSTASVTSTVELPLMMKTTRAKNDATELPTVSQKIAAAKSLTPSQDSVRYSFIEADDSNQRDSESNGSLALRRSLTPNANRLDLQLESLDEKSGANDSTEVAFSTAAELFDADPESLDEVFDFQPDETFAALID